MDAHRSCCFLPSPFSGYFSRLPAFSAIAFMTDGFLVAIVSVCLFLRYGCLPALSLSFRFCLPFAFSAFPLSSAFSF